MALPGNVLRSVAKYFADNGLSVNLVIIKPVKPESDIYQMDTVNMFLSDISLDELKGTNRNQASIMNLIVTSTDEDTAFSIVQSLINLLRSGICKMYNFDSDSSGVEVENRKITWVIEESIGFQNMPSDEEAVWMNTFAVRYIN